MLASAVTFVTYVGRRQLRTSIATSTILAVFFFAHSRNADARIISCGCDDRVLVGSF